MPLHSVKSRGIVFITGTDTGVGKTLLTAMLLAHLRDGGINALAMKPFCSGGTEDLDVLNEMQGHELTRAEINPFYFPEAVAPLVAARKHRQKIKLSDVLQQISQVKSRCDVLLIEGSGGLMVPLGEGFFVIDLIKELDCPAIVVGRNKLGVLNHTLLTVSVLEAVGVAGINVLLMGTKKSDLSSKTNRQLIEELLGSVPVFHIPYLAGERSSKARVKKSFRKFKKTLAQVLCFDTFSIRSLKVGAGKKTVDRINKKSVDGHRRKKVTSSRT